MNPTETQKLHVNMLAMFASMHMTPTAANKLAYLEGLRESMLEGPISLLNYEYMAAIDAEITILSLQLILAHVRRTL